MEENRVIHPDFRDDTLPSFRLNAIRRKYRRRLWSEFDAGSIVLESLDQCPCGNQTLMKIAGKDRFGFPLGTYLCTDCSLLISNPRIASKSLTRYYEEFYHPLVLGTPPGSTMEAVVKEDQAACIAEFLRQEIIPPEGGPLRVCEIGCASGSNLMRIRDIAEGAGTKVELYATELEKSYVETAKGKGINVLRSGLEKIRDFNVSFGLIIMSHVFEHLPEPSESLGLIQAVMHPESRLYIEVPGVRNLAEYGYDLTDYLVHAHMFNFDLNALQALVEKSGFKMLRGDETVRAVFKLGTPNKASKSAPQELLEYLQTLPAKTREARATFKSLARTIWRNFHRIESYALPRINHLKK